MAAAHLMHISALGLTFPDGPPSHVLVQGLNKVTYDLLELR